jgi:tetratricopeptide (TPR) repeat protein
MIFRAGCGVSAGAGAAGRNDGHHGRRACGRERRGMSLFDQSRTAFATGDYKQALELCNQTLKTMPNDAVVHEFRSLVLFALQKYRDSAAVAYAVLSAGPGWDWTTLSSLYGNVADYTTQLRALEAFVKKNPKSSDGRFAGLPLSDGRTWMPRTPAKSIS